MYVTVNGIPSVLWKTKAEPANTSERLHNIKNEDRRRKVETLLAQSMAERDSKGIESRLLVETGSRHRRQGIHSTILISILQVI